MNKDYYNGLYYGAPGASFKIEITPRIAQLYYQLTGDMCDFFVATPKDCYHYTNITEDEVRSECEKLAEEDGEATYYKLTSPKKCVKTSVVWK